MNDIIQAPRYRRIMVIDDTYVDRYIAEYSLKKFNLAGEIICKESAAEGLAYLTQYATDAVMLPEIILLDIRMPGMDGFGFLEEYEKLPAAVHQHCQVIMLSSSIDPNDHERLKNNPFVSRFIGKPLVKENLEGI